MPRAATSTKKPAHVGGVDGGSTKQDPPYESVVGRVLLCRPGANRSGIPTRDLSRNWCRNPPNQRETRQKAQRRAGHSYCSISRHESVCFPSGQHRADPERLAAHHSERALLGDAGVSYRRQSAEVGRPHDGVLRYDERAASARPRSRLVVVDPQRVEPRKNRHNQFHRPVASLPVSRYRCQSSRCDVTWTGCSASSPVVPIDDSRKRTSAAALCASG